ncbi:hypothetical protein AB3Y40_06140 [Yoonia sp. R2331]|uniref:hypothetical protein n=1 Tax=Yoonia sp. R2331 TaxID=3237238 RepID=UPI0034E43A3E
MTSLDDSLLAAHASGDHWALVNLYLQAADQANDLDASCFYLTHAYVFALEQNHPAQNDIRARLRRHGRI